MTILLDKRNFWPLLWKPKERWWRWQSSSYSSKHLVKNCFCRCLWSQICTWCLDILFLVIESSNWACHKTGLIYLTSHLLFHERIWPGKSKISLRVFSCEEGKRMEIIWWKILRAQMDGSNNGLAAIAICWCNFRWQFRLVEGSVSFLSFYLLEVSK